MTNARTLRLLASTCLSAGLVGFVPAVADANPQDGVVAAGQATISSSGNTLNIQQLTSKAVIDWRGFDIAPNEQTNFNQPSGNAVALNRVHSNSASQINGRLNANGNVVIVNQNGVMFGSGAQVDVNGIVATTADADNDQFMGNGPIKFNKAGSNANATVENQGTITAKQAGLVGLVAPNVKNSGVINARLGRVQLSSGDKATVDLYGDGLMEVAVSDSATSQLVENSGTINAQGGIVAITAASGKNIVDSLIRVKGSLNATTAGSKTGKILIAGNKKTDVHVTAALDASGKSAGQKGGAIHVMGNRIAVMNGTTLDASGDTGGGEILVGGDYHGGDYRGTLTAANGAAWGSTPGGYSALNGTADATFFANFYQSLGGVPTASRVFVDSGTLVAANALTGGNGGRAIFWSDNGTAWYGHTNVSGGAASGNGGFIEVSGHDWLDFNGTVDTRAAHGASGSLLLDPADITISTAAGSNISASNPFQSTGAASSNLQVSALQTALGAGSVIISSAAGTGGLGNVTFTDAVTWGGANALTVNASNNIIVNNTITSTGTGSIALNANVASTGDITVNSNITSGTFITLLANHDITIGAGSTLTTGAGSGISLSAAGGSSLGTGNLNLNGNIAMGTGNLTLISGVNGTRPDLTLSTGNFTTGASIANVLIQGFRDITINRDFNGSGSIDFLAYRDLTLNAGKTLTTGSGVGMFLKAAGNLITGVGNLNLLGAISSGSGSTIYLSSGINGTRPSWTATTSNLITSGTIPTFTINGLDTVIDRDLTVTTTSVTPVNYFTINTGRTFTVPTSGSFTTTSSNSTSNAAALNILGSLSMGTSSTLTLGGTSTAAGNGSSLTLTNVVPTTTTFGAVTISGYNDITIDTNLKSSGAVSITALRDLTLNAGRTITNGSAVGALTLRAANAIVTGTGNLNLLGTLAPGAGAITLVSGINGTRPSYTINGTNFVPQGANIGNISFTGFQDFTIDRDVSSSGSVTISTYRDFNLNATRTFSSIASVALGSAVSGTGVTNMNGILSVNSSTSITSGADAGGNRPDWTLTTSNFILPSIFSLTISGFRDLTIDRSLTLSGNMTLTAFRDLWVKTGRTVTAAGVFAMNAANSSGANIGVLKVDGNLVTSLAPSFVSGLDSVTGNRADITFNTTNLTRNDASSNFNLGLSGFRDITIDRDITATTTLTLQPYRNFTLAAGRTLAGGAGNIFTIKAANNVVTDVGQLIINGILSVGTSTFTLVSGVDGSGNRPNLTLNSTNLLRQGATFGAITLQGFNNITIDRPLNSTGAITISNNNLTTISDDISGGATTSFSNAVATDTGGIYNVSSSTGLTFGSTIVLGEGSTLNTSSGLNTTFSDTVNGTAGGSGENLNITSTGAGGIITISAGSTVGGIAPLGNFSVTADNLSLSAALNGTGTLTLTPYTAGRAINLGTASGTTTTVNGFDLNNTEMGNLANGWSGITFGSLTAGAITNLRGSWLDAVTFLTGSDFTNSTAFTTADSVTVTAGQDIFINSNLSSTGGAILFTAARDLTVASGITLTGGATSPFSLYAANNVNTGTGNLNLLGNISVGTGALNLTSGINGTRPSWTATTTNLIRQGATFGAITINGFLDAVIDRDVNSSGSVLINTFQNLTLNATRTLTTGVAGGLSLTAANGVNSGTGNLSILGNLSAGSGAFTLISGVNGTRPSLTFTSTNLTLQSTVGDTNINGFQDFVLNRDLTSTGNVTINAINDLTLSTGRTLTTGSAGSLYMASANGGTSSPGQFYMNGNLAAGTGSLTLISGLTGGTTRTPLTLNTTNFTYLNTSVGASVIKGFDALTLSRAFVSSGAVDFGSNRAAVLGNDITAASFSMTTPGTIASGITVNINANGTVGLSQINGVAGGAAENLIINSGTGTTAFNSAVGASAPLGNITVTANNVSILGALNGTGTLTLAPFTAGRAINLGTASVANLTTNGFDLNTSEMANLANGWSSIVIGSAAAGAISNAYGTWLDPVTFLTGNNFTNSAAFTTADAVTVTAGQDIFINSNLSSTGGAILFTAARDLTVASGITLTGGATSAFSLYAANNVNTGTGNLNLLGNISVGTGAFNLTSGINGTRPSWTATATNLIRQGATFGATTITGFLDTIIDRDLNSSGLVNINSFQDLTIAMTRTISNAGSGAMTLAAANGNIAGTGNLNILGIISAGANSLSLTSGANGTRPSLTLDGTNLLTSAGAVGSMTITGFLNTVIDRSITSLGSININSIQDLTLNASRTLTTGTTNSLSLSAASGGTSNTGQLYMNGNLAVGSGALTLTSGVTGGVRTPLTLNTTNFVYLNTSSSSTTINGFDTLTLDRALRTAASTNLSSNNLVVLRNDINSNSLTLGSPTRIDEGLTVNITTASTNTLSGAINGTAGGAAENLNISSGVGTLTLSGGIGATVALGNLTITSDRPTISGTLNGTGTLTLAPYTAGRTINLGTANAINVNNSDFDLNTTEMGNLANGWSSIVIGSAAAGAITNGYGTWLDPITFLTGSDFTSNAAITTADTVLVNAVRDIILNQDVTTGNTSTSALILAAGRNFINNRGATALNVGAGGRWLVYSTNPASNTGIASLSNAFNRYSCTYGGSCPALGTGNGLLYSYTPTLALTASSYNYTYGDAVIPLTGYSVTGSYLNALDASTGALTGSANSTSGYTQGNNAGTTYAITGGIGTLASTLGYALTMANASGTVQTRAITVRANDQTQTYGFGGLGNSAFSISSGSLYNTDTIGTVTLGTNASTSASGNYNYSATPWTITASGANFTSGSASNYAVSYANAGTGLTVLRKSMTITAGSKSMTYGAGNTLNGYSISGLQNGETIGNVTLATDATSSTSGNWNYRATPWIITASNAAGGTFDINNYSVSYIDGALTIGQKALTIAVSGINKVYDGLTTAGVTYGDNRITSDVLTVSGSASFANKDVGTGKTISVTGIGLAGADAGNYTTATTASTTGDITARTLTITAGSKSMTYGAGNTLNGYTASGLQNGETIGGVTLATDATGSTSGNWNYRATPWTITASGATGGSFDINNYNVNYVNGALTITRRALAVAASGIDKIYDGLTTASVTYGDDRITNDVLTASGTAAFTDKNVASGKTVNVTGISISGMDANNYSANTTASTTADITARGLTITAGSKSMTYGGGNTLNGYSTSGLQNGETIGNVTLATDATSSTSGNWNYRATPWIITASNAAGGTFDINNYSVSYIDGALTIAKRALIVAAGGVNKVYDGLTDATVNYGDNRVTGDVFTASGTAGFSDKTAANNKLIAITGITLTGADADNYNYNTTANTVANIAKRALTLATITASDKVYDGLTGATLTSSTFDNAVSGDDLSLTGLAGTFSSKNAGSRTVTATAGTLGGTDAANYSFTLGSATDAATITARALTITANGKSMTYGAGNSFAGYTTSGLQNGETIGNVTLATDATTSTSGNWNYRATPWTITASNAIGGTFDINNYNVSYVTGALSIAKRALAITVAGINKIYDGLTSANVAYADNRVSGDSFTTSGTATFTDASAASGKTITVNGIAITGADINNYTASTTASTTASIARRGLTITAGSKTMTYGAGNTLNGYSISGLQNGETIGSVDLSTNATSSTSGNWEARSTPWAIVAANAAGGTWNANNYTTTYVNGALTINRKALTLSSITADSRPANFTPFTTISSYSFDAPVAGDDLAVAGLLGTFGNTAVGTYNVTPLSGTLSGADAANYAFTLGTATSVASIIDTANPAPAALPSTVQIVSQTPSAAGGGTNTDPQPHVIVLYTGDSTDSPATGSTIYPTSNTFTCDDEKSHKGQGCSAHAAGI